MEELFSLSCHNSKNSRLYRVFSRCIDREKACLLLLELQYRPLVRGEEKRFRNVCIESGEFSFDSLDRNAFSRKVQDQRFLWGRPDMPGRVLLCRLQNRLYSEVPRGTAAGILLLWIMAFLDYYLTVYQIAHGAVELNPLLAPFFNNHHYIEALAAKMFLTFPGICILSIFYSRPVGRRALPLLIVVYGGLLVYHVLNLIA